MGDCPFKTALSAQVPLWSVGCFHKVIWHPTKELKHILQVNSRTGNAEYLWLTLMIRKGDPKCFIDDFH